jgi:hypothetical protein
MPENIPFFRVFLSSPGDVNDERKAVLEVLERLPNRPAFREKVGFRVVAWDKPGADTPMLATMSPQAAIDAGLPRPSQCDIVVVIFWSRMGTPFNMDGTDYLSGTHYEMLDALNAKRPETLIYRRTERKLFEAADKAGQEQYERVQHFFNGDLFYEPDTKQIRRGVNVYSSPTDFREKFETHLEDVIVRLLTRQTPSPSLIETLPTAPQVITIATQTWEGSPFPGLRAFTEKDEPIFFGRGRETDALLQRVADARFVTVIGASGSGKSSLVGAGLLPRLRANAISGEHVGSKDWFMVRFTPGKQPFEALAAALMDMIPALAVENPRKYAAEMEEFARDLAAKPDYLRKTLNHALKNEKRWAEVLLFIDQFEELFTLAPTEMIAPFAALLADIATYERARVAVTMRADFYQRAVENHDLAELLQVGSFPLAAPTSGALYQMITRPAERAALEFEAALPERILEDTGSDPGALALMAYALDELYKIADQRGNRRLTFADYDFLAGVHGAIGKRAEQTFAGLSGDEAHKTALLGRVFRELVEVDERGTATRQRALLGRFGEDELALIREFTDARLLVMDAEHVEVAHEALFRSWERLKAWIIATQDDLILLRQVRAAATDWARKGQPDYLRWNHERLELVTAMREHLQPTLSETELDFIEPEANRLLRELEKIETTHERRRDIGDRLAVIGDPRPGVGIKNGLPDIVWCYVPERTVTLPFKKQTPDVVEPFYISKYPITVAQYQLFLQANDGYAFFKEKAFLKNDDFLGKQAGETILPNNYPIINITWREATVFCVWLTNRLRNNGIHLTDLQANWEIRLPTEQEWLIAATGGDEGTAYPWGSQWEAKYANTHESGLRRITAVGMYPQGESWVNASDVAGNVWEWAINRAYWLRRDMGKAGSFYSVGGSSHAPSFDGFDLSFNGFRVVIGKPIV